MMCHLLILISLIWCLSFLSFFPTHSFWIIYIFLRRIELFDLQTLSFRNSFIISPLESKKLSLWKIFLFFPRFRITRRYPSDDICLPSSLCHSWSLKIKYKVTNKTHLASIFSWSHLKDHSCHTKSFVFKFFFLQFIHNYLYWTSVAMAFSFLYSLFTFTILPLTFFLSLSLSPVLKFIFVVKSILFLSVSLCVLWQLISIENRLRTGHTLRKDRSGGKNETFASTETILCSFFVIVSSTFFYLFLPVYQICFYNSPPHKKKLTFTFHTNFRYEWDKQILL